MASAKRPRITLTKMVPGRVALDLAGGPFHAFMLELERAMEGVWETSRSFEIKPDRPYLLRLTIEEGEPEC